MIALRVAEAESLVEYLRKMNALLPPSSPSRFDERRLNLVRSDHSLRILLQVTIAMMVLFDANRIEGYPELFAEEVTNIMDHIWQSAQPPSAPASELSLASDKETSLDEDGDSSSAAESTISTGDGPRRLSHGSIGTPKHQGRRQQRQLSEACLTEASRRRI